LVVDITEVGIKTEMNPRTGNTKMVPALRFGNWEEAKRYFRAKEANEETIESTRVMLNKSSVAVMTVV